VIGEQVQALKQAVAAPREPLSLLSIATTIGSVPALETTYKDRVLDGPASILIGPTVGVRFP